MEDYYGPTDDLPRGPEGKVLRSDAKAADFLVDDSFTTDVKFQAVKLSYSGKSTLRSKRPFRRVGIPNSGSHVISNHCAASAK